MDNIGVIGYGSFLPAFKVSNEDISNLVDTSDEWIVSKTGIKERRISLGEDTSFLATKAAERAVNNAGIDSKEIDLIITATITPDSFVPSVSCIVQKNLNADNAMAFDLSAACSGFVYGIQTAFAIMKSDKNIKTVLVIGAENLSKTVNWNDRTTCIFFGDGAGAVVLRKEDGQAKKLWDFYSKSCGKKGDALTIGALEVKNPFIDEKKEKVNTIVMNGQEIFKYAVSALVKGIKVILKRNNLTLDDISYIVPHQANVRILSYAAKKLNVSMDKFFVNIDHYGNTSSATIPIALDEMKKDGLLKSGQKIILAGFGGGLTFGIALIEL